MVYRQMPALWDRAFRQEFYARWGRESAIISARTRSAEYPEFRQLLSIKAAFGGFEDYFIDGRRVSVDDDTFLILNEGRSYGSRIDSIRPVHSFSIFFDPQLTAQVRDSILRTDEQLLDHDADHSSPTVEFAERLYHHDRAVTPGLRYICAAVESGLQDEEWIDEQLVFLLARMLKSHHKGLKLESRIASVKRSTRRELLCRMYLGVDYIYTRYRDPIGLRDIAASASLSPYHFLRTFRSTLGITPSEFLNRTRAAKALRLLQNTTWSVNTIAQAVGFGSRTSLFRHMSSIYHKPPEKLRGKYARSWEAPDAD